MQLLLALGIVSLVPGLGLCLRRQYGLARRTLALLGGLFAVGLAIPAPLSGAFIVPLIGAAWVGQLYHTVRTAQKRMTSPAPSAGVWDSYQRAVGPHEH